MFKFRKLNNAKILSAEHAVIQMPQRAYPAKAIQGDALAAWRLKIGDIARIARQTGDAELVARCDELEKLISHAFMAYNKVCHEQKRGGFAEETD